MKYLIIITLLASQVDVFSQASKGYILEMSNGTLLNVPNGSVTNVMLNDADLSTYAGITPSANIQTFLGSATYAVGRNLLLPSKTGNTLKFLRVNAGETDFELVSIAGGGDMLGANNLSELTNAATARSNIGLGNVTNESKTTMFASPTFTGTVSGVTATMVGLGNVTNESKATMFTSPTFTGGAILGTPASGTLTNCTFPTLNQSTTGSAATLTTPRLISGQSFNGSADISTAEDLLAFQALGSPILAETVGEKLFYSNVSTAMVDGQIKYTAVYLPKAATLTGIKVYVRVLGAYTGDNNNRVGLYTYSGGTITLVASSANSATLWTSAANAIQTIPFSSTYAAAAGIFFVAFIYNNSAQTTAPALASGIALNNLAMAGVALGFTNSAKLYGTSTGTDIPASIAMSGITASVIPSWVSLY